MRVLPTKWRRKPAGTDMERNYVTVILCIENAFARTDPGPVFGFEGTLKDHFLTVKTPFIYSQNDSARLTVVTLWSELRTLSNRRLIETVAPPTECTCVEQH